jgi:hypothetical protein
MSTDHVKLTREQRAAAGWVLCWGLYDWKDGTWRCLDAAGGWSATPRKRMGWPTPPIIDHDPGIGPRPFWHRMKPKPAKPTGEAFVRVTVLQARADWVIVKSKSGTQFGVTPKDIEREGER